MKLCIKVFLNYIYKYIIIRKSNSKIFKEEKGFYHIAH